MNTHRAVIESSVPPMLQLIAAGPREVCEEWLASWIATHPLGEFETGLVMRVETAQPIQTCNRCERVLFAEGVTCFPDVNHPGYSICRSHLEDN